MNYKAGQTVIFPTISVLLAIGVVRKVGERYEDVETGTSIDYHMELLGTKAKLLRQCCDVGGVKCWLIGGKTDFHIPETIFYPDYQSGDTVRVMTNDEIIEKYAATTELRGRGVQITLKTGFVITAETYRVVLGKKWRIDHVRSPDMAVFSTPNNGEHSLPFYVLRPEHSEPTDYTKCPKCGSEILEEGFRTPFCPKRHKLPERFISRLV